MKVHSVPERSERKWRKLFIGPAKGPSRGRKKLDHNPKSTHQDKRSCSREQLAKVHSKLKAKERSSLAGLEKALMESDSETEEEVGLGQREEMVEEEMFEAVMAKQTFLVGKPEGTDHSEKAITIKVLECSMEAASEIVEQVGQEGKQIQPVVQFGSFPPVSVNMVHILP